MKVLVACECSGVVRSAFRARGHEAWSCDIKPCEDSDYHHHITVDVRLVLSQDWDLVIAHPPCTNLCVSGARWFPAKRADGSQQRAIDFFMMFTRLTCKWAIENPIGIMSRLYRKPEQIVQPWQYGHGETKATCLWLNGLPKLMPTSIVEGREQRIHEMPPSTHRATERSRTYQGIANAMAEQWFGKVKA